MNNLPVHLTIDCIDDCIDTGCLRLRFLRLETRSPSTVPAGAVDPPALVVFSGVSRQTGSTLCIWICGDCCYWLLTELKKLWFFGDRSDRKLALLIMELLRNLFSINYYLWSLPLALSPLFEELITFAENLELFDRTESLISLSSEELSEPLDELELL